MREGKGKEGFERRGGRRKQAQQPSAELVRRRRRSLGRQQQPSARAGQTNSTGSLMITHRTRTRTRSTRPHLTLRSGVAYSAARGRPASLCEHVVSFSPQARMSRNISGCLAPSSPSRHTGPVRRLTVNTSNPRPEKREINSDQRRSPRHGTVPSN